MKEPTRAATGQQEKELSSIRYAGERSFRRSDDDALRAWADYLKGDFGHHADGHIWLSRGVRLQLSEVLYEVADKIEAVGGSW